MKPILPNINQAETLTSDFYTSESYFLESIEAIFAKSWLYVEDAEKLLRAPENVFPIQFYDKCLSEPILIREEGGTFSCMTNICTHRGFQIVNHPAKMKKIICGYHGRRFDLDGQVEFMPEFKDAEGFPRSCDHLTHLPIQKWKRFLFVGLSPEINFDLIANVLDERLGFFNMDSWRSAPEYSKTYNIKANWALYCDNYLEGFHIPFVHNDLSSIIDYGEYTTICYDHVVAQIGYGKSGEDCFEFPENHPDFGRNVVAYYYWIWPNFMLNIYTWGVQINIVRPISKGYCKVDFHYYIADEEKWNLFGRDSLAEKVEREDEFVVESVQQGMKSRYYDTGRYSPTREKGVHSFHLLIQQYLLAFRNRK